MGPDGQGELFSDSRGAPGTSLAVKGEVRLEFGEARGVCIRGSRGPPQTSPFPVAKQLPLWDGGGRAPTHWTRKALDLRGPGECGSERLEQIWG